MDAADDEVPPAKGHERRGGTPPTEARVSNLTIANPARGDGEVQFFEADHRYENVLISGQRARFAKASRACSSPTLRRLTARPSSKRYYDA